MNPELLKSKEEIKINNSAYLNKKLVALFLFFLMLGMAGLIYIYKDNLDKQKAIDYSNEELGISFKYPSLWGNVIIKDNFAYTESLKEISFSNQPLVKFFTSTSGYPKFTVKDPDLNGDFKKFCAGYASRIDEEKVEKGSDIFRQNGLY